MTCLVTVLIPVYRAKDGNEFQQYNPRDRTRRMYNKFPEFLALLSNAKKLKSFEKFLAIESKTQNLELYKDVQKYKENPSKWDALEIYNTYIENDAPLWIRNVSPEARGLVHVKIMKNDISLDLFQELELEVLRFLTYDSFPRFRSSSL